MLLSNFEVSILTFMLEVGVCLEVTNSFNCTRDLRLSQNMLRLVIQLFNYSP